MSLYSRVIVISLLLVGTNACINTYTELDDGTCSVFTLEHTQLTFIDSQTRVPDQSTVTVTCIPPYHQDATKPSTAYCHLGYWVPTPHSVATFCTKEVDGCDSNVLVDDIVRVSYPSAVNGTTPIGEIAFVECPGSQWYLTLNGTQYSNHAERVQCQIDGTWTVNNWGCQNKLRIANAALAGRLEVFHDGQWAQLFDVGVNTEQYNHFGVEEAKVACRQLNYSGGTIINDSGDSNSTDVTVTVVTYVFCVGFETSLFDCLYQDRLKHGFVEFDYYSDDVLALHGDYFDLSTLQPISIRCDKHIEV